MNWSVLLIVVGLLVTSLTIFIRSCRKDRVECPPSKDADLDNEDDPVAEAMLVYGVTPEDFIPAAAEAVGVAPTIEEVAASHHPDDTTYIMSHALHWGDTPSEWPTPDEIAAGAVAVQQPMAAHYGDTPSEWPS